MMISDLRFISSVGAGHTRNNLKSEIIMREGNLEAPTRHAIDWKNPEFYDEVALDKELNAFST